jgi:hypothetical protein
MEIDNNENILLVGEANFSFTISLADYFKNRNLITTTCYENLNDLKRIFGETQIENNLALLTNLNVNKVFFNIDACKLHEYEDLMSKKYSKIIFMFPHACCKKTNLKLNRKLLENFLISSKLLLKFNGCVYITLARGQGGTKFDINLNPTSIKANDNWQLVQIANKCGYLFTQCYKFDANLFLYYKSTGYKIQNKSFHIEKSLVHKLELALPINNGIFCLNVELIVLRELINKNFDWNLPTSSTFIDQFLKTSVFLHENQSGHVLKLLKTKLIGFLKNDYDDLSVNLYENYFDTHFTIVETDYKIVDSKFDTKLAYFIRNKLKSDDLLSKFDRNQLNIFSGLVLEDENVELNNYKYEILLYSESNFNDKLKNVFIDIIKNKLSNNLKFVIEETELSLVYLVNKKILFKISNLKPTEFICELDASYLCLLINEIDDRRLLYSSDKRNFNADKIQPYLIQTVQYTHDLCFWYNKNEFNEKKFLNLIRDLSCNQIKFVILIDMNLKKVNSKYKNDFDDDENISSAFYRLVYESYDRALDFDTARFIQDSIRDQIRIKLNLVPR